MKLWGLEGHSEELRFKIEGHKGDSKVCMRSEVLTFAF